MKSLWVVAILFIGMTLISDDVIIAKDGKAMADIVIPSKSSVYVKFAARELKKYLDKMTGADFKITNKAGSLVRINLGQSKAAEAAGLKPEALKRDGFFISAEKQDIFIVGVDNKSIKKFNLFHLFYDEQQRGTLLGVYEFLEHFGVRWLAPGEKNEFVPESSSLAFPEGTRKIEPFFAERRSTDFWDFFKMYPDAKEYCRNTKDVFLWGLRLKLSSRSMVIGSHTERRLQLKQVWADKPERFALIKGKRNYRYGCWTAPAVVAMWKKVADAYFSGKKPGEVGFGHLKPYKHSHWPAPFISEDDFMIDPMDHSWKCDGRCRCPRCEAFRRKYPCSDDSEIMWKVIAEVAESVKKKHPGKFISTLVYPPKMEFPKYVKMPDNIRVRICGDGPKDIPTPKRLEPFFKLVQTWSTKLGNKPPLWTYQCEIHGRKLPGPPETYPHLISEFLKIFRNYIAGMYFEQHALTHTYRNLDMYIFARLMWDPERDVDKELTDYFNLYYGPAAKPAQELFKRFEDNWIKYWKLATPNKPKESSIGLGSPAKRLQKIVWSQVYTQNEMREIDAIINTIEKAASGNAVYRKRAEMLRRWIFDIMETERAEVMNKKKRQTIKIVSKTVPDTSVWAGVPVYPLVPASRTRKSLVASGQFQLIYYKGTLYLRAELEEPRLAKSLTRKDHKNGSKEIWKDNDLEIFLYSGKTKDLWQIMINDQGVWSSQKINGKNSQWLQLDKFKVKVRPITTGWEVEAAIPLEKLSNEDLFFNLTRSRKIQDESKELSTWSKLAKVGNWHNPDNYVKLIFSSTAGE